MTLVDETCCAGESSGSAFGRVEDHEVIVVAVRDPTQVRAAADGRVVLAVGAISLDDLKGKVGRDGAKRGVSFERKDHCAALIERMRALSNGATADPLVAEGSAFSMRSIRDQDNNREICVFAEPTGQEDQLGPSESHGAMRAVEIRQKPPKGTAWLDLRSAVANRLSVVHLLSQEPPTLVTPANTPLTTSSCSAP